jgi:hypothetical protein
MTSLQFKIWFFVQQMALNATLHKSQDQCCFPNRARSLVSLFHYICQNKSTINWAHWAWGSPRLNLFVVFDCHFFTNVELNNGWHWKQGHPQVLVRVFGGFLPSSSQSVLQINFLPPPPPKFLGMRMTKRNTSFTFKLTILFLLHLHFLEGKNLV